MPRHSEATLAAIKNAVDIVALVGESLQVHRAGSKFKALCPFHDDHTPSLELNPDRQSYKCWSCGAGGDVFDFVKEYERVEFPEALRMLAERAGVALEGPSPEAAGPRGPSKSELLAVNAWAEGEFAAALAQSDVARAYLEGRGVDAASVARFRLGYAPGERGWLTARARRAGFPAALLEKAGLVSRPAEAPGTVRERFRGRLIFPIHDAKGRAVAFGGRILPEAERHLALAGKTAAKYLNSPETALFQKRRVLYAADLARAASRQAGWVAVVEGYTDVIAAHQVGLANVVGTLGTALGDDHVVALRRLADRVVLIFDGDDAGQNAADRSLEFFLGHEVDIRVLTLPDDLDPADFLLSQGADAFRALVGGAVDPLAFALKRAGARFDLASIEGSRQAAEWVLGVFARVPGTDDAGRVKVMKALDTLSQKLRVPVSTLHSRLRQARAEARGRPRFARPLPEAAAASAAAPPDRDAPARGFEPQQTADSAPPIRPSDLDPTDRELLQVVLNDPASVPHVITRVSAASVADAPLRAILQACYDLHGEGETPDFGRVALRLTDPAVRALAAGLLLPIDSAPLPDEVRPAPWDERLARVLAKLSERDRRERVRAVEDALKETDRSTDPEAHRALRVELFRLMTQRPDTKTA